MKRLLHPILASAFIGLSLFYFSTAKANQSEFPQNGHPQEQPIVDVYRYHGLKPATGDEASDGIYQDFSRGTATVGKFWADPDAKLHDGNDFSWVKSHVNRYQPKPYLTVEFARHGHGTSVSVVPKNLVPEKLPKTAQITFEARSSSPVCVGLRFMDRDGEIWAHGVPPLEYERLCVEPGQQWTKISVPIAANHPNWFKFQHSGNVELGNQIMEADLIAGLQFEVGLTGEYYFSPGTASFDLREITITPSAAPQP
ncbi:hypothetical protein [Leptothoe kymatousa]|uniref:Uncharacterized protein n=1 Tax=Leptothoe kymatousa TAU-MAC 1615 TaxID=2364775 RepID=A0ABS5Y282_9CYAN|nr:hypothetical protein [Leptothoe kymatousa]MBT9311943.1 hypothetical protein [Leptothoe kymatousa TAU-MAC 1615]